ncbi:unnamed protein product [Heligmosomoides polygyrus]|uniref:Lipoprotein n=1 Tax=Heligmosomoides polygyrus TaxID=6339 RepID=A0A183G9U2_HELPZ|nr:unnamed protein product [Heligmosomoides polygyrus]
MKLLFLLSLVMLANCSYEADFVRRQRCFAPTHLPGPQCMAMIPRQVVPSTTKSEYTVLREATKAQECTKKPKEPSVVRSAVNGANSAEALRTN